MTTSFAGSQYGVPNMAPGADRSEHRDTRPDTICRRIRTLERRPKVPKWSQQQVNRLTTISPVLEARINKLRADNDSNNVWNIGNSAEDGIHAFITFEVLNELATGASNEPADSEELASVVSEDCNVLWFYDIIPDRCPSLGEWVVRDRFGNTIGASNMTPDLFLHHSPTNGTYYGHESLIAPGGDPWCWNRSSMPDPYEDYKTAIHLANCALILDWKPIFKRAIKPMIWETGNPPSLVLQTPVRYLKQGGPDGINIRIQAEKEHILTHLLRYLESYRMKDRNNVETTINMLGAQNITLDIMPDIFETLSIYEMLQYIEATLLPLRPSLPYHDPPPPPSPQLPAAPDPRRSHKRNFTETSHKTTSSEGSNQSAAGPSWNPGPDRRDTHKTSSTGKTNKSTASKRHSGGAPGSRSSGNLQVPSSPPANGNRPNGPSVGNLFVKLDTWISTPKPPRESRGGDPDPDPPGGGPTGGPPDYDRFVRKMLDDMHTFVLRRQEAVADDILTRRDLDVAGWKARVLQ